MVAAELNLTAAVSRLSNSKVQTPQALWPYRYCCAKKLGVLAGQFTLPHNVIVLLERLLMYPLVKHLLNSLLIPYLQLRTNSQVMHETAQSAFVWTLPDQASDPKVVTGTQQLCCTHKPTTHMTDVHCQLGFETKSSCRNALRNVVASLSAKSLSQDML